MVEVFVIAEEGPRRYYLLKVIKRGFDVYCIPPRLGVHYSLHVSGESHFRHEEKAPEALDAPSVALVMGEAGTPIGKGIVRAPLRDLGRASGICTAIFSIESLSQDFRTFNRTVRECFVIDVQLFPTGTKAVEIGIWAVPARNKVSFDFNNPNIPKDLLYKVADCEPQIWVYARPI